MAQHHLEPLSAQDASLLQREEGPAHLHVGAVARFDGPPPPLGDFLDHLRSRLPLVPRHRRRLASPPAALGRPRWIDDPTFALEYHVRHAALPAPGDEATLRTFVARMFSRRLDRARPLWELWLVEGLEGGRFALVSKTHHALVEGVDGADLLSVLFDAPGGASNGHARVAHEPHDGWEPGPVPTRAQLTADALGGVARAALGLPMRAVAAATRPADALRAAREAAAGLGAAIAAHLAQSTPPSPLSVPIGPHRRLAFADAPLDDVRSVADAFGATVDDVVLAVTAGALRTWMQRRRLDTGRVELRACVPVGASGRLSQLVAPLPVAVADPAQRLHDVCTAMAGAEPSRPAMTAPAQGFAPPTLLARASRMSLDERRYDVLVANVPGPESTFTMLGRRMRDVHPVPFLTGDRALSVAAMSYRGRVAFGLLGDFDALPDVDVIAGAARGALAELVELAAA